MFVFDRPADVLGFRQRVFQGELARERDKKGLLRLGGSGRN
jgi:hypothetical protein